MLRAVEIFAGGGGLLLGTALAGFSHDVAIEWDSTACKTLRANVDAGNPLVRGLEVYEGDIRNFNWSEITPGIDLLAGGPPCQPFSLGGLARAALDPRDMFPAMTHAVAELTPKAFICENVKGLTRQSFSDYYNYILLRLQHPLIAARADESWREHYNRLCKEHTDGVQDELRYEVIPTVVNAADYGIPQHRERVFIVGFRSDIRANWVFPERTNSKEALTVSKLSGSYWDESDNANPKNICYAGNTKPWVTVRNALHDMPHPKVGGVSGWLQHELRTGAKSYPGHTGSTLDEPSKTIKAGVHGVPGGENMLVLDDGSLRYYSVREAARIQTFPDTWSFVGSWGTAMRQIGNAVPVELARKVASSVATCLIDDAASRIAQSLRTQKIIPMEAMA